jgi:NADPH:quinone reductase-like Zn-dependent oxidoreductase
MKAVRIHERGGLKQLIYEDALKPIPRRGDALVEVLAAGITPTELSWLSTYTTRDACDRLPAIPGHGFSGIVAVLDGASGARRGGLCALRFLA